MNRRSYTFRSVWRISAPVEDCWEFLTSPGQRWHDWWPRLRSIEVDRVDGLVGSRAWCTWRSPVGYLLRTELRLIAIVAMRRVTLDVRGDLDGSADVCFTPTTPRNTRIDIIWAVNTTLPWMNVAAPLLLPLFSWGHRRVMRGGERGLNIALG